MKISEDIRRNFEQIFYDAKEYIKLQTDYLRLQSVEKLTILISSLLIVIVMLILSAGALFYLFFTLAYAIAPLVGGLAVSFGIITVFYIGLIALLYFFREKLVVNPVLNLLMKLFYDKSDKDDVVKQNENDKQDGKP